MADLKISQLPELTTTPSSNSEIIVNDASGGDYVTKRVAMGNLLGGVSVFEPQKIVMSQGANGTGESVINYSTRQWAQRAPFVVGSSATQSATLPDGATHALIVWTTWNSWRSDIPQVPTDTSPIRHWRQYVAHRLNLTGGTYINNPSTWIQCSYTHTVPYKLSLPQNTYDDYYSSKNKTKTKLIALNPGNQTLSFDCEVRLIMGGNNKMAAYMGDIIILPLKVASTSTAEALGVVLAGFNPEEDGLPPDYTASQAEVDKSNAINDGNNLRSLAKNTLDVIIDYRDSYDDITGGPIPGDLDTTLQNYEKKIHSVVFNSNKLDPDTGSITPLATKDEVETELRAISLEVSDLIMKPFTFETAAGVTRSDIAF